MEVVERCIWNIFPRIITHTCGVRDSVKQSIWNRNVDALMLTCQVLSVIIFNI